jgi:hypothetical protein
MSELRLIISLVLVLGALAVLPGAGCSKSNTAAKVTSADAKAFDSATPEVKDAWTKLLAADAANKYSDAVTLIKSLKNMQMTDQQADALGKETMSFCQRMSDAAKANDPEAIKGDALLRQR